MKDFAIKFLNLASSVKLLFLTIASGLLIIPVWLSCFDKSEQKISAEEIYVEDNSIQSSNLILTGVGLFDKGYRLEEHNKRDKIVDVTWFIPFVPKKWKKTEKVKVILIFEIDINSNGNNYQLAVDNLDKKIDSLGAISNTITLNVKHNKFDFLPIQYEALNGLKSNDINLDRQDKLIKLYADKKVSVLGTLIVSLFFIVVLTFLYLGLKNFML